MKQLDIRQQAAETQTQPPSTADQVEKLKLWKGDRAEPSRPRAVRQAEKEGPRRIEVLLIIRNDRSE
jgi:hypothetical protein